jgi:hypothetical protein
LKHVLVAPRESYDAIVIGGGFYGCCIALFLVDHVSRVAIVEKEPDLLRRASYANQARVHNGYHYPRSFLTALRSFINFPRFVIDFRSCIDDSFQKLYAIARQNSKINSYQFLRFSRKIGAPVRSANDSIKALFNRDLIEDVFCVQEFAFNADALRQILRRKLEAAGVQLFCDASVEKVAATSGDRLAIHLKGETGVLLSRLVFNCAYTQINSILRNSGLPMLPLKHEVAEIALIEVPAPFRQLGITVMDGPFFSVMPFPALGVHSLSHVRYTPHESWQDLLVYRDGHACLAKLPPVSKYRYMISDARRYLPLLSDVRYVRSMFEIKTVLTENEIDDGRPILARADYGLKNFSVIMGSKIDNIYDVLDALMKIKSFSGERCHGSSLRTGQG